MEDSKRVESAGLAEMMPDNPTVKDVSERVLWLARQIDWCDSAAIFLLQGSKLVAEVVRSPYQASIWQASSGGLGIQEPFLVRALKERRVVRLEEDGSAQLFAEERAGIAIPIHDSGVLYLGRRTAEPFSEESRVALVALCRQAYFALAVARLSSSQDDLEREEASSRRIAESLLASVTGMVEVMSEILALTDPLEVLQCAGDNLARWADFEFWAILAGEMEVAGEPDYFLLEVPGQIELDREATLKISKLGLQSGRTVSFMNMERLTLPQPSPQIRSVLICPMQAEGKAIGCLSLGSVRACFSKHERELLSTLALQVGSHFWNLHLREQVSEAHRSLQLSQAQLIQSSKMAAVGQLAAGVAHELNTPLGAMNLAIEGAMRILETKPDRALSRLERALKSGNQLRDIVAKLLHYSKKTEDEHQETRLDEVVRDALELIGRQLQLDGVEVRSELVEVPSVLANHNELQQVIINLLTNARDAVLSRGPEEPLIMAQVYSTESTVELSISDNGTGMDDKTLERAFEPFFTTKEVGRGTGLGLSVTREIVERNHGLIEVLSTPGEGTTVLLKFKEP
ncbi:MAG: ATP-binding protein [Vulcanimicrobiota bacterium]